MSIYESVVTFFQSGGFFMIPIVCVLALGLAIAIERYLYLSSTRIKNQIAWKKIQTVLASGNMNEAMSFAELMKQVQQMDYSCIVFDTAPTGHTLRLLSFPTTLDRAFDKLLGLKDRFSGMFRQFSGLMGGALPSEDMLMGRFEQMRSVIQKVNRQFKDNERTTFVCVCIPEFLSLYETERLVQELTKYEIDVHNIVVNQVLFPDADSNCNKCTARQRMQQKYIDQIYDLYEVSLPPTHLLLDPQLL